MPFFYGKTVYFGITSPVNNYANPYYAFQDVPCTVHRAPWTRYAGLSPRLRDMRSAASRPW